MTAFFVLVVPPLFNIADPASPRSLQRRRACRLRTSLGLHLHRLAGVCGGARGDHQIPALDFFLAIDNLTDRPDRIDDRCAGGIGHKSLEGLQRPPA